ncbi:hypothetical protein Tco_1416547 [Tanacetum coccineum]
MSNFYVEREDSLEGDKSIPVKVVSSPTPHLGSAVGGFAGKPGVEDIRHYVDPFDALSRSSLSCDAEYDEILEDDFATASHSEEIDMTDSDVCRRALDQTITPAELRRTESLLPLELLNRVNVLSALLVSHGMELNTRYANLVASKARTEEKLKRKSGYVKELHSEVATLDKKLERLQRGWSVLDRENKELRSCNDVSFEELKRLQAQFADVENGLALERSKSQGYKDATDGLKAEIIRFFGSDVRCLLRKLLSSDEFNAALAHVSTLGITSGVERGLRMGRTDAEFEVAAQNVSNFFVGAKAEFNKALAVFPSTLFPFLKKVDAAFRSALLKVSKILPDKIARPATSVPSVAPATCEASNQAPAEHAPDDASSLA